MDHKFSLFILILTMGLMQWFGVVQKHFGGEAQMRVAVEKMRARLDEEKMRRALAQQELREFKQSVASVIPDIEEEDQKLYPVRNIASIVIAPDLDRIKVEKASTLFSRGKSKFAAGDYQRSNEVFKSLISKYPDSIHVVEAYFYHAEGRFREGEYEECLKAVEGMVSLFPEHELTGFSLIRMGEILTKRDRIEDAEQIYRTVLQNFSQPSLVQAAKERLKEIVL